jgi:hypothetical protein
MIPMMDNNVHAWFRFEGEAADMPAYSKTMFDPSNYQNGYYQITESDVSYNTKYHWNTQGIVNSDTYDVQISSTHELGHTLGLDDLYNKGGWYAEQVDQVMCTSFKTAIGNGDRMGVWILYGR